MKKVFWPVLAIAAGVAYASGASAQIKVGVAGPLTGPNAAFGEQFKNGAELAAADLNAKGGINGRKIELVFGDDVSDPKKGVLVANKMASDGVKFVIGHFNSGVTIPASDGMYMITPSATNPKITERGMWNVFRTCGRDDQQGDAIVHDETIYGRGFADGTKNAMAKGGMKEVLYEGVELDQKDFSVLVSKIKAARTDLVVWAACTAKAG
jgi:branched-chain amino acid transport system substrate-binding protein